jgi:hypothetical protein
MSLGEGATQGYDPVAGPVATMGPSQVSMRCPTCGQAIRAVVAPAPPTQWFPCPACHVPVPVVAPRELPPLYSWEVLPGLYPLQPMVRQPRWRPASVAAVALAVAAVLAAVSAGLLAMEGFTASEPAAYTVSGTVYEVHLGSELPADGARVVLYTDDNRSSQIQITGPDGGFLFTGVPAGGIEINATATGYAPTVVYTFASKSYATQTRGLSVTLEPGGVNNTSADVLSPFGDLASLLATVGGSAALLGGSAIAAGVAAVVIRRPGGGAVAVIGSGAALAAPVVLLLLLLGGVFPVVTVLAGLVGGLGAFALVFATFEVSTGRPAQPA